MGYTPTNAIWKNGCFIPWGDAQVHVLSHGLQYGSCVFEGLRAYDTPQGTAIFRNADHARRLLASARAYDLSVPYSENDIAQACRDTIKHNALKSAYLRPAIYRGGGTLAVVAGDDTPIDFIIAAIQWGRYLGEDGINHGIDACISSWRRLAIESTPVTAKAAGHYLNAQLIASEAKRNGYAEGIALNTQGTVSECSAANLFVVHDQTIYTPPLSCSILSGITRDSIITLAHSLTLPVIQQPITRDFLCSADEAFLTGTAAEVTPIRSIDRRPIGTGKPGPITTHLQATFFGLFNNETEDQWGWLDLVQ